jgi:2-polyprenyl-6-methoxyphenol hydroxylase-like FAD-dependent oxidoreductase
MDLTADVVVVGAGPAGAATALMLARSTARSSWTGPT